MTDALTALIERAVIDLDTVTKGGPLCRLTSDGRSAPTAKYLEGRWAALTELQRSRERGHSDEEVLSRWRSTLQRHTAAQSRGDWIAYDEGGVDALTEVLGNDAPHST